MATEPQFGRLARALDARSTIGVVSPASCVERAALEAGCRALHETSGWRVANSAFALCCENGFAGSAEARAASLMEMWQREDVDAVVCARGGYGSNYLLPLLDFDALRMTPKAFVGYSDNTALLLALERAGLAPFHGPMVASDFARGTAAHESFVAALGGEPQEFEFSADSPVKSLVAGEARGAITGGCLSVVVTSLGTPWEIETEGKILFLEDVNEKLFRIDRMLMHLLHAGKFRRVRGVVFGAMCGCGDGVAKDAQGKSARGEETLAKMILRLLGPLGVPIVLGVPSGHVESGNITLPFGVPAVVHSSENGVRLQVEAAAFKPTQV